MQKWVQKWSLGFVMDPPNFHTAAMYVNMCDSELVSMQLINSCIKQLTSALCHGQTVSLTKNQTAPCYATQNPLSLAFLLKSPSHLTYKHVLSCHQTFTGEESCWCLFNQFLTIIRLLYLLIINSTGCCYLQLLFVLCSIGGPTEVSKNCLLPLKSKWILYLLMLKRWPKPWLSCLIKCI